MGEGDANPRAAPPPPPPSPHPKTPCSPTDGACTEATTTFSSKHIGVRFSPPLQEDSGFGAMSFKWITCSAGGGADTTMKAMSLKCSCGLQPRSLPRRLDVPGGDDAPQERISVLPVVSPRSFDDQCELPPKRPGGLFWPSTNNGSSNSPRGLVTSMAAVCPRGQKRAGGKAGGDKPLPGPGRRGQASAASQPHLPGGKLPFGTGALGPTDPESRVGPAPASRRTPFSPGKPQEARTSNESRCRGQSWSKATSAAWAVRRAVKRVAPQQHGDLREPQPNPLQVARMPAMQHLVTARANGAHVDISRLQTHLHGVSPCGRTAHQSAPAPNREGARQRNPSRRGAQARPRCQA